jgi:CubicO group peptidase (beta-lactamase class C family)
MDRRALLLGLGTAGLPAAAFGQGPAPGFDIDGGQGFGAALPPARPEEAGMSSQGLKKISAIMADYMSKGQITGGVTAVARRNKLVHYRAHGTLDEGAKVPMRPDAEFVMMSSTKPVTGVALLQQMEAGKVKLSDPITKFVPELAVMRAAKPGTPRPPRGQTYREDQLEPANRVITIQDLATHTSGLNGSVQHRPGDTLANFIPRLKDVPLDFQPGTRWAYSATTGPDILARVVEICSGQPYDAYLKQHVFDPIGMNDTRHNLTPEQHARLVRRYVRENDKWAPAPGSALAPRTTTYFAGSYGLQSTARDYMLFETMLLNRGTINGRRVLKPESVELMHTNLVGNLYGGTRGDSTGTGFGVLVRTVIDPANCRCGRAKGGFGWGGAYGTMSWTDPANQLVAAIMIQQPVNALQRDFEMAVQAAIQA